LGTGFAKVNRSLGRKATRKISHIAKYCALFQGTKVSTTCKSFLQKHGYRIRGLVYTPSEEVLAFLKAHAKGGNKWKRKKEWDREAWLEEFQRTNSRIHSSYARESRNTQGKGQS
jgi:hypothetical protein